VASVVEALKEPGAVAENSARVVWTLAWPAVALNSLQVVNTLLDRGFIGHLHTAALTAHGGATNIMFLMFSLAVAVSTGATALVSRAFGAGQRREMRMAARQSLGVAVFGGIAITVLTASIAGLTSAWLLPATAHEAKGEMTRFLSAYACGLPAIFVIQALAGSLRGIGDTKSPMVISGIQILLHITLNFLLIFPAHHIGGITIPGAGLGLTGAACALAASATMSAIAYVFYIRYTPLGRLSIFRIPEPAWVVRILRIALPAAVMATLRVLSLTAFTLVLKQVGNAEFAIAAMSVAFAIESVMFMPAFGLSAAAGALVGQSLGMRDPKRAERLAWTASCHGALVTASIALPIFIFAPNIATELVGGKLEIAREAWTLLRYLCATETLFGFAMVLIGALQGAGDTVRPLWISLFSLWGLRVPLALVMALPRGFALGGLVSVPFFMGMGSNGAWIAMAFTQGIQGVFAYFAFRQGAWKTKKV
jgi:MATE family, multidrug efflux pump